MFNLEKKTEYEPWKSFKIYDVCHWEEETDLVYVGTARQLEPMVRN